MQFSNYPKRRHQSGRAQDKYFTVQDLSKQEEEEAEAFSKQRELLSGPEPATTGIGNRLSEREVQNKVTFRLFRKKTVQYHQRDRIIELESSRGRA